MSEEKKKLYCGWVRLTSDPEEAVPDDEIEYLVAIGGDKENLPLYRAIGKQGPLSATTLTYPLSIYKWFANAIDEVKKPQLLLVKSIEKQWGPVPSAPDLDARQGLTSQP